MVAILPRLPAPILRTLLDCATDEDRRGEQAFWILDLDYRDEVNLAVWTEHGAALVAAWIEEHPGTRPSGWWRALAPRQPIGTWPHDSIDGKLQLPRERLGGIGTPAFEVLGYVPSYRCGIPDLWVRQFEVELYNGRARDIHGAIIMPEFIGNKFEGLAPDPNDPPTFEAEAVYLRRHGLLLPGEARRLTAADFEPEQLVVDED